MGTKTIGLREDVYERLRERKRGDESFTDLIDRLLEESSTDWRETFGTLPEEEASALERAVERSRAAASRGHADRQRTTTEAFEAAGEDDGDETA